MSNSQEKFDFDITPEYFSRLNLHPDYPKLVCDEFLNYEKYNEFIPQKLEENYKKLDPKYLAKLPFDYRDKIKKVKEGMKINQAFYTKIASLYINTFNYVKLTEESIKQNQYKLQSFMAKLFLQILIRDWGQEGEEERSQTIMKVIQELKKYYNYENKPLIEKGVNILVIGSKFGRIVYELAKLGYNVEANENGYFYLLVANYLFNYSKKNELCVCPRISSFCSSFTEESVTKKHYFPDVDISSDLKNVKKESIKITKRYFEIEYADKNEMFDCVITLFGTGETKNIINYTETVYNVLKKGGIWINLGGLSSSYSGYGGIDLTWEEWKHVMIKTGFEFKREETLVLPYIKFEGNSIPHTLGTVFFTAQK